MLDDIRVCEPRDAVAPFLELAITPPVTNKIVACVVVFPPVRLDDDVLGLRAIAQDEEGDSLEFMAVGGQKITQRLGSPPSECLDGHPCTLSVAIV